MNDFFNLLGSNIYDKLCDIDHSLHKSGQSDTLIDNFVHELKDYLFTADAKNKLSKIPSNSILEINEIEDNYIQCYLNDEDYLIPNKMIDTSGLDTKNVGFIGLQLQNDGLYHIVDL